MIRTIWFVMNDGHIERGSAEGGVLVLAFNCFLAYMDGATQGVEVLLTSDSMPVVNYTSLVRKAGGTHFCLHFAFQKIKSC